jgi:hypothetical protein
MIIINELNRKRIYAFLSFVKERSIDVGKNGLKNKHVSEYFVRLSVFSSTSNREIYFIIAWEYSLILYDIILY